MANNSTSLYTTSSSANVASKNFTTLYTNQSSINTSKTYGNANVAQFLLTGDDGANVIAGITDKGYLIVEGKSTLGPVANVTITGGSSGYVLVTDGTGNLSFVDPATIVTESVPYIHFDVTTNGNNQQFTTGNLQVYESNNFISLFKNGVNLEPSQFVKINATTIQVNVPLLTGDSIDILSSSSGGRSTPAGTPGSVQFNGGIEVAGSTNFTFDTTSNTVSTTNLSVDGNVHFTDVSNVHITGGTTGQFLQTNGSGNLTWATLSVVPNYANFAGTAFSVSGSNVSGTVANATYAISANTANFATVAANANSVQVANVVGIGNIATINKDGNALHVLYGDGTWGAVTGNVSANYASFAGTIVNNSQPNITSTGTLTSLTVTGNVTAPNFIGNATYATSAGSSTSAVTSVSATTAGTVTTGAQPNITSLGTLTDLSVTGMTSIQEAKEKFVPNGTGATGTVQFDVLSSAIILQTTNATANFTLNIRGNSTTSFNSIANSNESTSITYINKNGATGYYANVIKIDGTTITPVWVGGNAISSGTVSGYDVYNFNILKTATNTYTVFAAVGSYK